MTLLTAITLAVALVGAAVRMAWKLFRRLDTAAKQITGAPELGIRSMQQRFDAVEKQVETVDAAFRRHTADGHGEAALQNRRVHRE